MSLATSRVNAGDGEIVSLSKGGCVDRRSDDATAVDVRLILSATALQSS